MTTNEDKGLKPGMWCDPFRTDDAGLWWVVHDIATTLVGLPHNTTSAPMQKYWVANNSNEGVFSTTIAGDPWLKINPGEFIRRMFEQAEINKKAKQDDVTEMIRAKGAPMVIAPMEAFDHEKRIKAVEETTKSHEAWIKSINIDTARMGARVKALEARLDQCDPRESQEAQRKYEYPLPPHSLIGFRKEDSLKNIPFEVALVYAKAGRGIRRPGWAPKTILTGDWIITEADMLADDWEVVPEQ